MSVTVTALQLLKTKIDQCQDLAVLTGAGISAESGVPTFRGPEGLWRQYRAVDLATPQAFQRDPRLVWEFYQWRRQLLQPLRPNPAHEALAVLERRLPRVTIITQNIDGLHALAGSQNIIELHGNIWYVRCTGCSQVQENRQLDLPPLPVCQQCGSLLRPHVVWFGETLDPEVLAQAYQALTKLPGAAHYRHFRSRSAGRLHGGFGQTAWRFCGRIKSGSYASKRHL